MSKKAVYSNKGLQVYITGEDFEELLENRYLGMPLFIGKVQVANAQIIVNSLSKANIVLKETLALESQAIDKARNEYSDAFAKRSQSIRKSNRS